jgi:hypothetical protein
MRRRIKDARRSFRDIEDSLRALRRAGRTPGGERRIKIGS